MFPPSSPLVRRVVPLMQASGNFQWSADYPNEAVFTADIERKTTSGWPSWMVVPLPAWPPSPRDQDAEYAQADWDVTEPALVTHRLAVDPATQGRGVALALMAAGRKAGRGAGIEGLARRYQLRKRGHAAAVSEAGLPVCGRDYAGISAGAAVFLLREAAGVMDLFRLSVVLVLLGSGHVLQRAGRQTDPGCRQHRRGAGPADLLRQRLRTGLALLGLFFGLGTAASGWRVADKRRLGLAEENKGRRTAGQVVANAGVAGPAGAAGLAVSARCRAGPG